MSLEKKTATPAFVRLLDSLFGIDLRTIGLFRIALALFLLFDLFGRTLDLTAHYTDSGVFPRTQNVFRWSGGQWYEQLYSYLSLHMLTGEASGIAVLFATNALCLIALLVGYRTRLFAFLSWVFLLSLQNRNPNILHGGDQMIRILLFWGMFLPLGARFSVDGLSALTKAYGQRPIERLLSFGTAGLLWQTGLLYWFTTILKNGAPWHGEGSALWYALNIEQYQTHLGRWFLSIAPLWLLRVLTWGAIGLEGLGPTLAFVPFKTDRIRIVLFVVFWCFHLLGIGLFMDVGPLPGSSALLWIPFLPTLFWERANQWWAELPESLAKLKLTLLRDRVVAWRNRRIAGRIQKREPLPILKPTVIANIVAALSIVYVSLWNLRGLDPRRYPVLPKSLDVIANVIRVDQQWGMFAPQPTQEDGWFVIPATLEDGREVDLYRGARPVSWEKPEFVAGEYPNERWRKYLMNLWAKAYIPQRPLYMQYVRNNWNRAHPNNRLKRLSLYYMLVKTPPLGQKKPAPKKELLFNETYLGGK